MVYDTLRTWSHTTRARPSWHPRGRASAAERRLSPALAGRAAAAIFVVSGAASLASVARPDAPGEHPTGVLVVGLLAVLVGLAAWHLPWERWSPGATLWLVPVGFAAVALRNAVGGDDPYLYAIFFVVIFTWVGLAHPEFTGVKLLPLFAAAYLLPLVMMPQHIAGAVGSVVYVGVVCAIVSESVAAVSVRWRRADAALERAHIAVSEICVQLGEEHDPAHLWQNAALRLCALLDVPNCDIYRLEDDDGLVCVASALDGEPYPEYVGRQGDLSVWAVDKEAIRTGGPVLVSSLDDPRLTDSDRAAMLEWGEHAALIVPLQAKGRALGLVEIGETRPGHTITDDQATLALSICRLIALSVRDSEVIEAERRYSRKLSSLFDSCAAIAGAGEVEDALAIVVRRAVEAFDMTSGIAYEYEPERDAIVARAFWETTPSEWNRLGEPLPLAGLPFESEILRSGRPVLENLSDPKLDAASRATMERWGEKCCLTIPMGASARPTGLLTLWDSTHERRFTEDEMSVATSLAELAGETVRNAKLTRDLRQREEALRSLHEAGNALAQTGLDYQALLDTLVDQAMRTLDCSECLVFEYDSEGDALAERSAAMRDDPDYTPWSDWIPVDEYPGARRLLEDPTPLWESVSDPHTDPASRADMESYGEKTCLSLPLRVHDRTLGFLVLGETERERVFTPLELQMAQELALRAALAIHNARTFGDLRELHLANLRALGAALHTKDRYTQGHAARVAAYMILLGHELGWSAEYSERVGETALLHDVGKLGVSDRILLKHGPLNEDEWFLMRQHPTMGAEILRPLLEEEFFLAVRHHHERFEGGGYPDGLAGQAIPALARAMAVADSYDAMSRRRPYRRSLTAEECRRELLRCSGTQFDPAMVTAFLRVLDTIDDHLGKASAVAALAGTEIDADDIAALVGRCDETRPQYGRVTAALRRVRDAHPGVRYLTVVRESGEGYTYVADPEEDETVRSHIGDRLILEDELPYGYSDDRTTVTVLDADEYGVWMSGFAPVRDHDGEVVALVVADVPVDETTAGDTYRPLGRAYSSLLRETAQRISKVEIEAITDGLTGLYNHRHLHEKLAERIARASHHGAGMALLFIDIDRFKVVNDRFGHGIGDRTLRDVARVIENCTRKSDIVARYGGEEFVALLTDASTAAAHKTAERIRQAIREEVKLQGGAPLSVSIGLARLPDDAATKEELLEKADRAMYAAKRRGRDQVVAFGEIGDAANDRGAASGEPSETTDGIGPRRLRVVGR